MKILVLNGNPKKTSYCRSLAASYAAGARSADHQVELVNIHDLDFMPLLHEGYDAEQTLEPDLLFMQQQIKDADHLALIVPVWWGSVPASLKGFFDRILLPGFAFKYEKDDLIPKRLLTGKSAHAIITMDTPVWYYKLIYGAPATKMLKKTVLTFCGFSPVNVTHFGSVLKSNEKARNAFLKKVYQYGKHI